MSRPVIPRRVLVSLLRAVAVLAILLPFLGRLSDDTTPVALAHNLDQRMNWIQYDAATRAVFDARIAANDLPLVRVGDEVGMIIKVTPTDGTNTGAGGYVTFYVPNGAQVVDAAYLTSDGSGGFNRAPMKGQSIEPLGDGPIGAKVTTALIGLNLGPNVNGQSSSAVSGTGLHLGTLAGVYGDTGIFYSTDPTTAWQTWVNSSPPLGVNITNNRGEVMVPNNKWDAMQMYAWGIKSPVSPIVDPDGRGNSPWGMANGVAGPQSGYAWSFDKDFWDNNPGLPVNQRMQGSIATGPWQRIKYPGSQISKDTPGNQDNTLGFAEVDGSAVGLTLNPGSPLPPTTSQTDNTSPKAVRWSVGGLIINRPEYVYVKVKLLDPAPYTNCITMFDTDVVGGDAGGLDNAKDHLWRYYQPTSTMMNTCVALSKRASREVVGQNGVFQYDIDVYNTSSTITLTNVQIQDTLPSGISYLSASPAPNSGPNPLVWTIPTFAPGQKFHATVTVKATSTGIKINTVCMAATNLSQTCTDEVTYVGNLPLLIQTKSASPTTINPGDPVQYTITINNIGTGATTSPMALTDYLPSGFTYGSLNSVTLNGANALGLTTVNSSDPTKPTFTVNGSINASGNLILVFTAQTSPNLLPGQYCNTYYSTQAGTQITSGTEGCVIVGGGSIGDTVFRDWNGNGAQDATDEGLPGVAMNLYAGACPPSGGVIKTATTDLDGKYLFTGLNAGSYCVDAPSPGAGGLPSGYTLTAGSDPRTVTLAQNEVNLTIDFGYRPGGSGSIGDLVFEDKGNDGAYNPGAGDVGIAGVTVNLYEDTNGDGSIDPSQDALVATTTTNGVGAYLFSGLATGLDYIVDVVDANITSYFGSPAWVASTGDPLAVPSLSGSYLNADFGFARVVPGSIGDQVFRDQNKDGVFNAGDAPIPFVTVHLYQDTNGNGALDTGEPLLATTATDGAGLYSFTGLPAGKYIVDVDETDPQIPGGYAPSRDLIPITLGAGQARTDADFPFVQVLRKTLNNTNPTAGQVITYTITPSYPGNLPLSNLIVTDSIPAGTTFVGVGQGGVLGSGYISMPGTAGYRPASLASGSLTLSPSQDTWVNEYSGDKNKNFGGSTTLSVDGETGKRRHALLQFNLSSIPSGATITGATLTLTKVGGDSKTSDVEVRALTQSWGAGTKNGNTCSLLGEATWVTRDCLTPWATAGGTINGTSYATATVPAAKTAVNWTVTSLVQAWVSGTLANNGLLLQTAASSIDPKVTQNFGSMENGTPSARPTLQISYTAVAGPDSGTTIGVSPTQVNPGGTFAVTMVLTSTGTINTVFPNPLNISGTNGVGATCGSPTPGTPQTLTPGPGLTFTWSCTASGGATAGELSITGNATGSGGYVFATASGDSVQVAPPGGNIVTWDLGSSCPAVAGVTAATGTALCPSSVSLTSVADTHLRFGDPTKNYGSDTTMLTRPANASSLKHSLVRFDVSSIPAGAVIQSATLNLTVTGARSSNHFDKVYRMLTAWTEGTGTTGSGASWNTRDGSNGWLFGGFTSNDYDPTLLGTITPNANGLKTLDVTAAVDAWVNGGQPNNGLAVVSTGTDGGDAKYATREDGTASRRPSLSVVYLLPTVGGCSGTVSANPQADTWVIQDSANANHGTDNLLSIKPDVSGNKQRISLMKFDLSGIPAGATITSATLSAQVNNTSNQWDANIYRLLTAWTETGATWNKRDGASGWAGGAFSSADYNATVYGPLDFSSATPPSVNVTSLVQAWVTGAPNEGIALLGNTQSTDEGKLYSREESNTSRRPLLTVNWSLPANPGAQTTTTLHVTPLLVGG
ncbi:MAG: DNRLRE domain-containing protein, partial [Anaerolineae bacterium]|nr:DNRLRE domain-containing protein [Anaerolineae bacterium]